MKIRRTKPLNALLSVILLAGSLCGAPAAVGGTKEDYGLSTSDAMVIDAVIIRPVMLVTTAVGVVAFVASLPFTIPSDSVGKAGEALVVEPAAYTFTRPLGEFD